MTTFQRIAAFVSGFILCIVVVFIGGYLAALPIPRAYFEWFGQNKVLALSVAEAVVFALPVFLLAFTWSYFTIQLIRGVSQSVFKWCLFGLFLAWFFLRSI